MTRFSASILFSLIAVAPFAGAAAGTDEFWKIAPDAGIVGDVATLLGDKGVRSDHIEMGGRAVDAIVEWKVAKAGASTIDRRVRFPMLRGASDNTHASLAHVFRSKDDPLPLLDGRPLPTPELNTVAIREGLAITTISGPIEIRRTVFPSSHLPALIERWEIKNTGAKAAVVTIPRSVSEEKLPANKGKWASHIFRTEWIGAGEFTLAPGESLSAGLVFSGREDAKGDTPADAPVSPDIVSEWAARRALADRLDATLTLVTPDAALNRMFAMAKLRSVESIAATRGGLMQGPGGYNNFNAAIWCNDNVEYMAPYHAYLGDAAGVESARVTYAWFAKFMNPEFRPIPSSVIGEGRGIWNGAGDRGDAAMIAQGASRFLLANGDKALAREIWPLIEWCLEYCEKKKTADGVIASKSDELEGRFSSGKTNLATSSLAYDGLVSSAMLARELGLPEERAKTYEARAVALRVAIEKNFGAKISGFDTYRYHDGLTNLRAWICLPLAYGILDRAPGTLDALYSPELWTADGLRTDAKDKTFWDRSTLFALRATFIAGDTERGLDYLTRYSRRRLLGDHVPYAIEAYPEAGKSHLSGESCLYARIFIEGILGMRPTGFRSFDMTPRLPKSWPSVRLERMHAYGRVSTVVVTRVADGVRVVVTDAAGKTLHDSVKPEGATRIVNLAGE
jgi:hypothetical protein